MRRGIPLTAAAALLAGPTVLAFYAGGYFAQPQLIAGIVAWALVAVVALFAPPPFANSRAGWFAVAGLAVLTAWTALSITWAPLRGEATHNVELCVLYLGALILAIMVLRPAGVMRTVEPALAAGILIVIGYGLSGRLLPGVVHLAHSINAHGRLEQPITYWNSEGALAAIGLVLCARLVGDHTRPRLLRMLAAAASGPLGAGIYLSYSRGAIAATVVGLFILLAAAPVRAQFVGVCIALAAGIAAAAFSSAFPGVASLHGSLSSRESDGVIMFVILAVLAVAAALITARAVRAERLGTPPDARLPGAGRLPLAALAVVAVVVAGLLIGGLREKPGTGNHAAATPSHLTSVNSNRYAYWRAGARAFLHHPVDGLGAGGFSVYWLRVRPVRESVQNAHSLELEVAAELGLVGLLALAVSIAGVGFAARRAWLRNQWAATGPSAAAVVWLLHTSADWDWQLPAVTLPAIILAGNLIALASAEPEVLPQPPLGRRRPEEVQLAAEVGAPGGAVPAP